MPQATDNCEVTVTQESGPASGTALAVGTHTILYHATDNAGNSVSCQWTITVVDTQDPTAVCQDITIYLDENGEASIIPDDIDGGSSDDCALQGLAISMSEFDCDNVGDNQVTLTVTDAGGNTAICVAEVTVVDNIAPTIECPDDINVTNDPEVCGAIVEYPDILIDDNCPVSTNTMETITFDYTGGVQEWVVPAGVTEINIDAWGASGGDGDFVGNIGTGGLGGRSNGDLTVTPGETIYIYVGGEGTSVEASGDYGGGGFNGGGDAYGGDNGNRGGGGGASDVRQGGSTLNDRVLVAGGGGGACCSGAGGAGGGLVGQDGQRTVGSINGSGGTQTSGGLKGCCCDPSNDPNGTFGAGGFVPTSCSNTIAGGGGGWYGGGAGNNAGGGSSYLGGVDNGFTTMGAQSGNGFVTISYNVSGLMQVAGLPSGSTFPVGTTVNHFIVTDPSGNTAECSFSVTVTDDELPTIACPANVTLNTSNLGTTGDCFAQYEWEHPIADDNCGVAAHSVVYTNPDGTIDGPYDAWQITNGTINPLANHNFGIGNTTITYYVDDVHGNTNTCAFVVTVADDELPEFLSCPPNITVTTDVGECSSVQTWSLPQATDNCEVTVTQESGPASGTALAVGTHTILYHATDNAGNSVSCQWTITV
ncbi:MAG: HYR domain-containing protein, partial [Saprospiraceae bacterium]